MATHSTLIKPPKSLPHHSPIENVLSLLPLVDIGPDIYTNARPLWHPPGARGIYGGAAIAQCLAAAQATIPKDFTVHSMHCYFVLAGNSEIPILYHVERVRDGKSFITRTVQARQRGKCIFTTTLSFMKEGSGGKLTVKHAAKIPAGMPDPPPLDPNENFYQDKPDGVIKNTDDRPFESVRLPPTLHADPAQRKLHQWLRARGRISDCPPEVREVEISEGERANQPGDNHQAHLSALAYMSDSYFIGTVARVHNLIRFASAKKIQATLDDFDGDAEERAQMVRYLEGVARDEEAENKAFGLPADHDNNAIGMMVSLDHAIYFHNPRAFRADEWMLTEMETPWAGDGRGLVLQRMWSKDGTLIATCVQEGCVRLQQRKESKI